MPLVDRREIAFDAQTIAHVITSAVKAVEGLGLPPVSPNGVTFVPEETAVRLVYGKERAARYITLPAEALGSLLIWSCIRSKLPLPRRADKSIRVEHDCCILAFRSQFDFDPQTAAKGSGPPGPGDTVRSWSWAADGGPGPRATSREPGAR